MALLAPDAKDSSGRWISTYIVNGVQYKTKANQTWQDMKSRCVERSKYHKKRPTYIGCTVSEEFLDFQYFADWYSKQVGYGELKYDLDKDILVPGNKVYGEKFCVLVPTSLNSFLSASSVGPYPTGVAKNHGKFMARVNQDGIGRKYLGNFGTYQEAFGAYKSAKQDEALRWTERLRSGEFLVDARVITALENWKYKEEE